MNLFLDTNVLLSFYHFNKDDTKELKKLNTLVRDNSIKLLMTQQVIDEYYRNRTNKIKDSISKLKEQRKAPKFPRIATSYKKYNDVIEAYKNYDKEYQNLIEKIYEDIKNFTLPADSIIKDLFKLSTVLEVEDFIIEKAKKRMIIGNPPGKKNSHGDAINWETLLNNKDSIEELHFISIDADYESVLNEGKINEFLEKEWNSGKNKKIYYYKLLTTFFKKNFPDVNFSDEFEKKAIINQFINSNNFQNTHYTVELLNNYKNFEKDEIKEIIEAIISNSQIYQIIHDPDIEQFINEFLSNNKKNISIEEYNKISDIFNNNDNNHIF